MKCKIPLRVAHSSQPLPCNTDMSLHMKGAIKYDIYHCPHHGLVSVLKQRME